MRWDFAKNREIPGEGNVCSRIHSVEKVERFGALVEFG